MKENRKEKEEGGGNFVTLAHDDENKKAKFLNFKKGTKTILDFEIEYIIQLSPQNMALHR